MFTTTSIEPYSETACDSAFHLVSNRDVDLDEQSPDGGRDVAATTGITLGHDNFRTLFGEPVRDAFADTCSRTGDQRDLAR